MFRHRPLAITLKSALIVLLALATLTLAACSLYRQDRAWISDDKYRVARDEYNKTGSLLLTELELERLHWGGAEVNEAIYRLKKQYRLD
jgi:hypothetical protein